MGGLGGGIGRQALGLCAGPPRRTCRLADGQIWPSGLAVACSPRTLSSLLPVLIPASPPFFPRPQKWLQDHGHYVQGVAWDPLGRYVASQSADRTARIYSVKPPGQGAAAGAGAGEAGAPQGVGVWVAVAAWARTCIRRFLNCCSRFTASWRATCNPFTPNPPTAFRRQARWRQQCGGRGGGTCARAHLRRPGPGRLLRRRHPVQGAAAHLHLARSNHRHGRRRPRRGSGARGGGGSRHPRRRSRRRHRSAWYARRCPPYRRRWRRRCGRRRRRRCGWYDCEAAAVCGRRAAHLLPAAGLEPGRSLPGGAGGRVQVRSFWGDGDGVVDTSPN